MTELGKVCICHLSTQEAKAGLSQVQGQPWLTTRVVTLSHRVSGKVGTYHSPKALGLWNISCHQGGVPWNMETVIYLLSLKQSLCHINHVSKGHRYSVTSTHYGRVSHVIMSQLLSVTDTNIVTLVQLQNPRSTMPLSS